MHSVHPSPSDKNDDLGSGNTKGLTSLLRLPEPTATKRTMMDELLVDEHHGHAAHSKYICHPFGVRRYWDIVTTLLVLYLCWRIPFDLGLDWWYPPKQLKAFELFADIWFAVDILLNFRTGHVHDGHLVMDPKKIAAHYFEFWFWIDIIATIPFELFGALFANKSSRKAIKLVKWFKIPRLMRLGRVLKYLRQYAKFYSLIMVTFGIILMTHMFGCIFVACVNPCGQYDYDPYTYTETSTDGPCAQKNAFKVWARALHYGVTMLMGGSVRALDGKWDAEEIDGMEFHHNASSDMFSYIAMLFGLWLCALFFGEVAVIAHHGDRAGWDFRVRLKAILETMSSNGLPDKLQKRVKIYYDYLWMNNLHGKHPLLDDPDMSVPLKKDITTYLYRSILGNVSFLKNASPDVVTRLCSFLILEVYMPKEYIFQKGDRGHHLYIIKRGTLSVLRNAPGKPDDEVTTLTTNSFFGETALLSGIGRGHGGHRAVSTRAVSIVELLQLSIRSFNQIITEFPNFKEEMLNLTLRRKTSDTAGVSSLGYDGGNNDSDDGAKRRQTWVQDDQGAGNPNDTNGSTVGGGSNLSSDQLTSLVRACMLEMRRDLEHNMNDRFQGLEDRLNDTIETLGGQ